MGRSGYIFMKPQLLNICVKTFNPSSPPPSPVSRPCSQPWLYQYPLDDGPIPKIQSAVSAGQDHSAAHSLKLLSLQSSSRVLSRAALGSAFLASLRKTVCFLHADTVLSPAFRRMLLLKTMRPKLIFSRTVCIWSLIFFVSKNNEVMAFDPFVHGRKVRSLLVSPRSRLWRLIALIHFINSRKFSTIISASLKSRRYAVGLHDAIISVWNWH